MTYTQFVNKPLEERIKIHKDLMAVHQRPMIAILVTWMKTTDPKIEKFKYLCPAVMTVGNFLLAVKRRLPNHDPVMSIFLICDNVMLRSSDTLEEVYSIHHNKFDHFLYITYTIENTFGST